MKSIALQTLADFADGKLGGPADAGSRLVTRVVTDSRKVQPGDVFVALAGDKFDAHDFIPQVMNAGAAAVVVNRVDATWGTDSCATVEVKDTLVALQDMARGYRAWHQPLIIGLTGSNGKTSTKDLTALVMGLKVQTRATLGNLNNHIGLPLTLLSLEEGDECGVVEMGMNHPGEIKTLVDIALPDAAIVTNVGMAHIEYMGSQDAIGWEKGTLPTNVHAEGVVVLNANDPYTPLIARHCQATVFTAGTDAGDVRAFDLRPGPDGTHFKLDFAGEVVETFLPVMGDHMVGNAALAACMGWAHGILPADIAAALSGARLTGGRMETKTVQDILFIDDSYNANPDSMKAGLATLASLSTGGKKIAVLGRMGELGIHARSGHEGIGQYAAGLPLTAVYTVGDEAAMITEAAAKAGLGETANFPSHEACAAHLKKILQSGDAVLLKGSRSAGMEKVLAHFKTA
ncbi:UDP-N-acetylmuramoyl-tripeptide--D-alanyl-D-alanine ligase [Prosthecobacter fusiformis]|uniref:UDP-N-acetylmuramoyl-tripeptide--D-alanyl-D-alanine ligase n=1 Tax=Prosthecobacter fusiformis TaxID=48464 RepID=A0A4R7RL14_9BACT|nr:UDP-N-acetylmuramoyl-tripeptide--D-alanyl-D-alanine ligase [Prosthecobacter fusiformis]TDU64242.1 UDP-N-acetylmuramoyl-tripeptide--D-alanyl-D-alanine ligase [Prosthecobacter fusiformis]